MVMKQKSISSRKDTVTKCKERIQNLLKLIVRKRDGDCIFRGIGRTCSGPLSADHIVTRGRSRTYGMSENVVCVCIGHHLWWKPSNPTIYTNRIDEYVGQKNRLHLEKIAIPITQYKLKDWQEIEAGLKEELRELMA